MKQPLRTDNVAPPAAAETAFGTLYLILAFAIAAIFAGLLLGGIDFPLGTHADEKRKAIAVITHRNTYSHPILMLELVRAANAFAGLTDPQAVAELGRAIAVLIGAATLVVTFLLARQVLPPPAALAATAAAAVTPLVAMHARFLKEDIFVLLFILLSLLALIRALKSPTAWHVILVGVAVGLATATKYVAIVLLPFAATVLLVGLPALDWRSRLKLVGIAATAALAALAFPHLPVLWEFRQFADSLYRNLHQVEVGHFVAVPLALTYGLFHLRESLLPGLGAPLLILGLLGFAAPLVAPPERRGPLLVIAAFTALWLVAHEVSPLKPYPDFHRYMVPAAPLMIILGAALVYELARKRAPIWSGAIAAVVMLLAALPALHASVRIAGTKEEDLRRILPSLVLETHPDAAFDYYTSFGRTRGRPARHGRLPDGDSSLLVTASFVYDRYGAIAASDLQKDAVRLRAARYTDLFQHPYLEVSNGRPSFAFFNPVFRVVALDGDKQQLSRLAAELRAKYPDLTLTLVNAKP